MNSLLKITPEAKKWIAPEEKPGNKKKIGIIVCIAIAILGLVGAAIAAYYCFTTQSIIGTRFLRYTGFDGRNHVIAVNVTEPNGPLAAIPLVFGPLYTLPFLIFPISIWVDKYKNKFRKPRDLRDARDVLSTAPTPLDLDRIPNQSFFKRQYNLGPCVRQGLLTPEEGNQIALLISEYSEAKQEYAKLQREVSQQNEVNLSTLKPGQEGYLVEQTDEFETESETLSPTTIFKEKIESLEQEWAEIQANLSISMPQWWVLLKH